MSPFLSNRDTPKQGKFLMPGLIDARASQLFETVPQNVAMLSHYAMPNF